MRNLLQEQLLKAGLAKKGRVDEVAREQARQRQGKASTGAAAADKVDAARLQAERAAHDRALAAERNAQARQHELRAQARQIVQMHKVERTGDIAYGFNDGGAIRRLFVDAVQRAQLAKGALVIVRVDDAYELLPRAAAEKVSERLPGAIVLDHARSGGADAEPEDPFYDRFKVPDDLVW